MMYSAAYAPAVGPHLVNGAGRPRLTRSRRKESQTSKSPSCPEPTTTAPCPLGSNRPGAQHRFLPYAMQAQGLVDAVKEHIQRRKIPQIPFLKPSYSSHSASVTSLTPVRNSRHTPFSSVKAGLDVLGGQAPGIHLGVQLLEHLRIALELLEQTRAKGFVGIADLGQIHPEPFLGGVQMPRLYPLR